MNYCRNHDETTQCGCNSPERTRRTQEAEQRPALRLTERDGGYECALPITFAGNEPKRFDWQVLLLWIAVPAACLIVAALLYRW